MKVAWTGYRMVVMKVDLMVEKKVVYWAASLDTWKAAMMVGC